ncbi:MAG: TfoX family protein [Chitinophagia bacterium]|nr:TfoX family protein [Chitinophagia bacterium]
MAYNEQLNDRIREILADHDHVEEKNMFGGVCYMLNGKMCVGIVKDEMMCRVGPAAYEQALEREGCREMVFTGKPMKGYVYVSADAVKTRQEMEFWLGLCIAFNKVAKATKKK